MYDRRVPVFRFLSGTVHCLYPSSLLATDRDCAIDYRQVGDEALMGFWSVIQMFVLCMLKHSEVGYSFIKSCNCRRHATPNEGPTGLTRLGDRSCWP